MANLLFSRTLDQSYHPDGFYTFRAMFMRDEILARAGWA
jgi:hypothetical protein